MHRCLNRRGNRQSVMSPLLGGECASSSGASRVAVTADLAGVPQTRCIQASLAHSRQEPLRRTYKPHWDPASRENLAQLPLLRRVNAVDLLPAHCVTEAYIR